MKKSFCLFCGGCSETGSHDICREKLSIFRNDMRVLGAVNAMKLAENGHYGKSPHRASIEPTDWMPRAIELRAMDYSWRKIAEILNQEGFTSKHGHKLDSALIINNLHNNKKRGEK